MFSTDKLDEDVHKVLNMYYRINEHIKPPQTSSKPVPAQFPHVAVPQLNALMFQVNIPVFQHLAPQLKVLVDWPTILKP